MARELVLEVVARKNSKDLNALADDFDKAARKAESAGKSFDKTATFSKHLDDQIAETRKQVRSLGEEFDKTGNKDVFANLRGAQTNLKSLERIKKDLSSALGQAGDDGGKSFKQRFENAIGSNALLKSVSGALGGLSGIWSVVTPLLVAGAPVAGAAIGAALLTGVGLAGIGAGIAGQLHDPAVDKAATDIGKSLKDQFTNATVAFKVPMVAALNLVEGEVRKLGPGLKQTFDQLAPLTATLGQGLSGFIDKLAPSLEKAAIAGKPLVELLANRLPGLGAALGNIFDAASRNASEAKDVLNILLNVVDVVINGVAFGIDVLSKAFDIAKFATLGLGVLADVGKTGKDSGNAVTDAFNGAKTSLSGYSDEAAQAAAATQQLNKDITNLFNETLNVDQANIQLKGDMAGLKGQLDAHSKSLDTNTAAGRNNASALLQIAQDAERAREAAIQQAGGENASKEAVDAANAKYQAQIGKLEALAIKLGLGKDAVKALLDKYKELANSPDITKQIYITTHFSQVGGSGPAKNKLIPFAHGGIRKAQFGLFIPPSDPGTVLTGEPQTGGEVLAPMRGNSVVRQAALLNAAGANYGLNVTRGGVASRTVNVVFAASAGAGDIERAVLAMMSRAVANGAIVLRTDDGHGVRVR